MKAEIYQVPQLGRGWHWKIKTGEYSCIYGFAMTKWGAEYQVKRSWKKYNARGISYEIELDDK